MLNDGSASGESRTYLYFTPACGVDSSEIDRVERAYRRQDCERLELQSATGDLHAGQERAFGADRALPDEEVRDPA